MKHAAQSASHAYGPAGFRLRLKPIAAIAFSMIAYSTHANAAVDPSPLPQTNATHAGDVTFDNTYLRSDSGTPIDTTRFARGNTVSPGMYSMSITINGTRVSREDVKFAATEGKSGAQPCVTRAFLTRAGVDLAKPDAAAGRGKLAAAANNEMCGDIGTLVPGATADFDFTEQRLALSVPQAFIRNSARGYVPPDQWDQGVNGGLISYNANTYRTDGNGAASTQSYLGLNTGVNVGAWHFRHQGSITMATGQKTEYDNIATYAQRDVPKLGAQLTIGDSSTTGEIFDSVPFRGAQLATDDRMFPESMRGFAPVVRGVAETNARVAIRQNGKVLQETTVAPGPFEINDLYSTGSGGDLDVTVTEADGRTKEFTVPFASVAQLLRPGRTRFSATACQLRNDSLDDKPGFAQFTLQHGLTNTTTAYGGAIASSGYAALNAGGALNTKVGAFSTDITGAATNVPNSTSMHGVSLRVGQSTHRRAAVTERIRSQPACKDPSLCIRAA